MLDLAIGPGYAAATAIERGASVVGVDVTSAMIQQARRRHPDIDFHQADAEALPVEDRSSDAFTETGATPPDDIPVGPSFFRYAADEQFAALLAGNGLTDVEVWMIAFNHSVSSADELWNGSLTGTVKTSAFFLGQSD